MSLIAAANALIFFDVFAEAKASPNPQIAWAFMVRGIRAELLLIWIVKAAIAPPLLVTAVVARLAHPRDRRALLLVGGTVALLPTFLFVLDELWLWIRLLIYGHYY